MKKVICGFILILSTSIFTANVRAADEPPWQRFVKDGAYTEDITMYGRSRTCADLVVEITKSGGDKEGEYRYSTDNGANWSDIKVIKCGADITVAPVNSADPDPGVKIRFISGKEFTKGNRYTIHLPIMYEVEDGINVGTGKVLVSSEDVIYNDSYKLSLKITKSGSLGEGAFSYSEDGKRYSKDVTIPQSGAVSMYGGKITVTFWDGAGKFLVGDEYRCEIKGDMSKRDYTPYVIAILAGAAAGLYMIYGRYSGMRDKEDNYSLFEYTRVEAKRNRKLSKRRQY